MIYKVSRAMLIGGGRDNVIENNIMLDCERSIRFDNRGLNWMQNHVMPGGSMRQRLADMPYRSPPWSERYPQLLTLLDDEPGAPKYNTIRLNVFSHCKPTRIDEEVYTFSTIADNLTTNDELGFVDVAKMDFRLRGDSIIFKELPGFKAIPFEKIGLRTDEFRKTVPPRQP